VDGERWAKRDERTTLEFLSRFESERERSQQFFVTRHRPERCSESQVIMAYVRLRHGRSWHHQRNTNFRWDRIN
jgi:hypothetical protein